MHVGSNFKISTSGATIVVADVEREYLFIWAQVGDDEVINGKFMVDKEASYNN